MKIIKIILFLIVIVFAVGSYFAFCSGTKYKAATSDEADPINNAIERFAKEIVTVSELKRKIYADEDGFKLDAYMKELGKVELRILELISELEEKKNEMNDEQLELFHACNKKLTDVYPNFWNTFERYDSVIESLNHY